MIVTAGLYDGSSMEKFTEYTTKELIEKGLLMQDDEFENQVENEEEEDEDHGSLQNSAWWRRQAEDVKQRATGL